MNTTPALAHVADAVRPAALVAAVVVSLIGTAQAASPTDNVMLVLDASGSMWGKVDGRHKVEIAREAVATLLDGWPADRALGLLAYGHRRKGDCGDIETLVPVGPADAAAITARVDKLNPKGKTPISAAVQAAAEALRYREERATVILVSDGLETCDADPCALGKALEADGIDFTAHIIGFDIADADTGQLACLAEATGGRFLAAGSAAELNEALEMVAASEPPATAAIGFHAIEGEGGPRITEGLEWQLSTAAGEPPGLDAPRSAYASAELPQGEYTIEVVRDLDGERVGQAFSVSSDTAREIVLVLPPYLPPASLEAPATVAAGSDFALSWQGPGNARDFVLLVPEDADPTSEGGPYAYAEGGATLTLRAPDAPGRYELRYRLDAPRKTLATRAVEVVATEASLEAPDEVAAGSRFEVTWRGPDNDGDFVTVVPAGAAEGRHDAYVYTRDGSPLTLPAPDAPGDYELRYATGQDYATVARRPLKVASVTASLEAPDTSPAGSPLQVAWTGPSNEGDYVTIVKAGEDEGRYGVYAYTRDGSPVTLKTPDAAGQYELRYVTGQAAATLALRALEVVAVEASLDAAAQVPAGSTFVTQWTGPGNEGDYVTIVPLGEAEGRYGVYDEHVHADRWCAEHIG